MSRCNKTFKCRDSISCTRSRCSGCWMHGMCEMCEHQDMCTLKNHGTSIGKPGCYQTSNFGRS